MVLSFGGDRKLILQIKPPKRIFSYWIASRSLKEFYFKGAQSRSKACSKESKSRL